ncbi:RagB/SusD family nutrient uptake outer membrane protein [Puteibacter caeruleilacunae]|nr:RagB/SusD family nutrient uptake outer membrane protein [Puteibacter caeruleilacunae]
MRQLRNILTILILSLILNSCEDKFLDLEPTANPTDVTFFADANQLQLALNGIYGQLAFYSPEGMPVQMYMETILTDNGLYRITDEQAGLQALSNSVHDPNSGYQTIYNALYKAIGRANNMLQNMDRAIDTMDEAKYNDFRAQALTLRAYYYHFLIEFFGDVPFLDFLPTTPTEGFLPRTAKTTIVQTLLSDLDEAAGKIDQSLNGAQERVTLAIVQGLKARIALYAGEFSTAVTAADAALAAANSQGIELYGNYEELFSPAGEAASEIMMRIPYDESFRTHNLPLRMGYRFGSIYSQMLPTQNLVDAYPTINGLPIDEDPEYDPKDPWSNRDPRMRASIVFPQDLWGGYIHESHRDSLKATKIVDGVATRVTNENCRSAQWPAGLSGYLWRKFVDIEAVEANQSSGDNDIIIMRLGELYLIKAEAEIEANGDLSAAAEALNMLRERAWGGDDYPRVVAGSQSQMRKILRMERRVELANEGFRYIDMLRWRIAEKVRNEPLIGRVLDLPSATTVPSIDEDGVVTYPDRSEYDDWRSLLINGVVDPTAYDVRLNGNWQNAHERNFTAPRDYLLPIPQSEIDLYEANGFELTQNPGY